MNKQHGANSNRESNQFFHSYYVPKKYSVEVILEKIKCLKVVEAPLDTEEDLCGSIEVTDASESHLKTLFEFRCVAPLRLGKNQGQNIGASYTFSALSEMKLKNLEFKIGGHMSDAELLEVKYKACTECTPNNVFTNFGYRRVRMSNYFSQVQNLSINASKYLTVGDDKYMELNWYEGDLNSSHVRAYFKIKVKRLQ